ncbi:nuclear transport factor 2 family protein [Nocardia takedensis]
MRIDECVEVGTVRTSRRIPTLGTVALPLNVIGRTPGSPPPVPGVERRAVASSCSGGREPSFDDLDRERKDLMTDWLGDYYACVDSLHLDDYVQRHSTDASFVFGSDRPANGREEIAAAAGELFAILSGLRHERRNVWFVDEGNTALVEAIVHCTTTGGVTISLPAFSVLQRVPESGLISSLRVYSDMAPLFSVVG